MALSLTLPSSDLKLTIYEAMTATATNTSFENKHLENGDYFAIISSSSHPLLSAADGARCKWTGRSAASELILY